MIGAISSIGPEMMTIRHGPFKWEATNAWVREMIRVTQDQRQITADEIVLVCDNAPVHSRLELVAEDMGFHLLRLGPYSPMLSPIENLWSVVKASVKRSNHDFVVEGPGIATQRTAYFEGVINGALETATPYRCIKMIMHSNNFLRKAAVLEDMPVGE